MRFPGSCERIILRQMRLSQAFVVVDFVRTLATSASWAMHHRDVDAAGDYHVDFFDILVTVIIEVAVRQSNMEHASLMRSSQTAGQVPVRWGVLAVPKKPVSVPSVPS